MNNGRPGMSRADGMVVVGVLHEGSGIPTESEGLLAIYYM